MRVLVTGAGGFVGAATARDLAEAGFSVRAAARRSLAPAHPGIETVTLPDLAAPVPPARWAALLADMDAVVHGAGLAHQPAGTPAAAFERINHAATAELAHAARAAGITRFVLLSSIAAQTGPNAATVLDEDTPGAPNGAYGQSKRAAEDSVIATGLDAVVLRPTLVHGPGAKGNMAQLLRLSALPVPLPLGNLTGRRSLVSIRNLTSAIRFALSPGAPSGRFIVADETPVTAAEIVACWRRAQGRAPNILTLPAPLWRLARPAMPARVLERLSENLVVSAARLRRAGWQPVTDAPEALAEMAQAAAPRKFGTA